MNQLVNILQRGSGQTETGAYWLHGWSSGASDNIGTWASILSRVSTPASVSIDTSLQTAFFVNTPNTNTLNQYGFHISCTTTGAAASALVGGLYTVQF